MVCFNTRKHSNEAVYYNIDALEEALLRNSRASFCYFDLDENRNRVYRKEKQLYLVEPASLVFMEDNYYLLCYTPMRGAVTSYRVDRMDSVRVEDAPIGPEAMALRANISAYTGQMFKMFGGESRQITLQFDRDLMGAIYDRFGEGISVTPVDARTCQATLTVRVSPIFWGWLFQFGDKMRLMAPKDMAEEFRQKAIAAAGRYECVR